KKCLVASRTNLRFGDLTKTESLNYLCSQNVDEATAEEAYNLVGGRIILLQLLQGVFCGGTFRHVYIALYRRASLFSSFLAEVCSEPLRDARTQLVDAELLPPSPLHEIGSQPIRELLDRESLDEREYYELLGFPVGLLAAAFQLITLGLVTSASATAGLLPDLDLPSTRSQYHLLEANLVALNSQNE
ncbi:hypothetical protein MMC31_003045, partial [Peltigera leucophlebia]|nr:hypothetical protein [Peltigera leucophlebia]